MKKVTTPPRISRPTVEPRAVIWKKRSSPPDYDELAAAWRGARLERWALILAGRSPSG